jgi:hypothetical protein
MIASGISNIKSNMKSLRRLDSRNLTLHGSNSRFYKNYGG